MRQLLIPVPFAVAVAWLNLMAPAAHGQCAFEWKADSALAALNGPVYAMTVWDDGNGPALYVGGGFTIAGGVTANHTARWDGGNWSALDSGMNDVVSSLTVFNGMLVAGGSFTTAGALSANRIATWDGVSWSALGSGFTACFESGCVPHVNALILYDGGLIAGGEFSSSGATPTKAIAKWDGVSWSEVGGGLQSVKTGAVYDFRVFSGKLIAGGSFETAGGGSAWNIAQWDGSIWSALGSGMRDCPIVSQPCTVTGLGVYDGSLFAGGLFTTAGGVTVNHAARWNGGNWSTMGSGLGGCPNYGCSASAMTVYNGSLIGGGEFGTAGGITSNNIARWKANSWAALGTGVNNSVSALAVYNGSLIAGGGFTTAGGVTSPYIARWGPVNDNTADTDGDGILDICEGCDVPILPHPFYNNSFFDSASPACTSLTGINPCNDNTAVATDKTALLPGQTAGTSNYISYSKGLNGLMIDMPACTQLPAGPLGASNFEFKMSNSLGVGSYGPAPAPVSIDNTPGAGTGGGDRIRIIWTDNSILNRRWLRCVMKSDANGGIFNLASDYVFYFGLAIGDSETPGSTRVVVNSTDEIDARNHPHNSLNRVPVATNSTYATGNAPDAKYDYDKSSTVSATDEIIARNNPANSTSGLLLLNPAP